MHELAIAETVFERVRQRIRENGFGRVKAVGMRIGALSDVVPDALTFGFELVTKDTELDGVSLEIEQVPVRARCKSCKHTFPVKGWLFVCPLCSSGEVEMLQGMELEISYLKVEDEPDGEEETQSV